MGLSCLLLLFWGSITLTLSWRGLCILIRVEAGATWNGERTRVGFKHTLARWLGQSVFAEFKLELQNNSTHYHVRTQVDYQADVVPMASTLGSNLTYATRVTTRSTTKEASPVVIIQQAGYDRQKCMWAHMGKVSCPTQNHSRQVCHHLSAAARTVSGTSKTLWTLEFLCLSTTSAAPPPSHIYDACLIVQVSPPTSSPGKQCVLFMWGKEMQPPANTDPRAVKMHQQNAPGLAPATTRKIIQLFDLQNAQVQQSPQR